MTDGEGAAGSRRPKARLRVKPPADKDDIWPGRAPPKTTSDANAVIDADLKATRKKTERLKAERLAKEASDQAELARQKPKQKARRRSLRPDQLNASNDG